MDTGKVQVALCSVLLEPLYLILYVSDVQGNWFAVCLVGTFIRGLWVVSDLFLSCH